VVTDRLLEGALDVLLRSAAPRTVRLAIFKSSRVPGAWRFPPLPRQCQHRSRRCDRPRWAAFCAAKPPTTRPIYNEVARGIGQSQQETGVPHSFGVLTCETLEQALNRAGIKAGNKGFEAAAAAIEMVNLRRKIEQGGQLQGGAA